MTERTPRSNSGKRRLEYDEGASVDDSAPPRSRARLETRAPATPQVEVPPGPVSNTGHSAEAPDQVSSSCEDDSGNVEVTSAVVEYRSGPGGCTPRIEVLLNAAAFAATEGGSSSAPVSSNPYPRRTRKRSQVNFPTVLCPIARAIQERCSFETPHPPLCCEADHQQIRAYSRTTHNGRPDIDALVAHANLDHPGDGGAFIFLSKAVARTSWSNEGSWAHLPNTMSACVRCGHLSRGRDRTHVCSGHGVVNAYLPPSQRRLRRRAAGVQQGQGGAANPPPPAGPPPPPPLPPRVPGGTLDWTLTSDSVAQPLDSVTFEQIQDWDLQTTTSTSPSANVHCSRVLGDFYQYA